jgi:hypothetical protein
MLAPNAMRPTSPSMGEVSVCVSTLTEGVRAPALTTKPPEAVLPSQLSSPPQSALRADSSPIEGEQTQISKVIA